MLLTRNYQIKNIWQYRRRRLTHKLTYFPIVLLLFQIVETEPLLDNKGGSNTSGNLNNNNNNNSNSNYHYQNGEIGQHFAMEPQDQTAIVGSRATLPCRVINKVGSLQWTKDDFGLGEHRNLSGFERYSMVGSDEEGDFSLDIYPVMLEDDARYQCQVGPGPKGQPGIRSRFAKLIVLVPPEAPKIVQGDFLITTEDREIELECISVGGKPAAEITWIDGAGNVLKNGIEYIKEPLPDSRRFTAKSILKLTPKKEHHNTTFTCQAQNTADRTYRSAKLLLEVKYAPKVSVSVVSGALAGGRIAEGSEVRLSCHADANPSDVNYRWYINDEAVIGDYTTEMIIHNVSRKYHDAIVKCEVYNVVGKSEESETLDISYGPEFKRPPKSIEADLGTTVTLSCDVDGNPPADIVWINGTSEREVGSTPNLTLKVTEYTSGHYYCKASVIGFPEIDAEVSVFLKRPPRITSSRTQIATPGDNAHLECVAFSVPKAKNVLWSFHGHEINISANQEYSILDDQLIEGIKSILVIRDTKPKHFGKYNCTVINEYGSDEIEIELIANKTIPFLVVIVGAVSFVTFMLIIVVIITVYLKKGKKKLPPADVIPEHHHHHHSNEKGFKESDRSSNLSDLKVDIRSGSCEPEYSETCSDSLTTKLASNMVNANHTGSNGGVITGTGGGGGGGVPLAGPVKIPNDFRYSGDYTDSGVPQQQQQNEQKLGQQNSGFDPYVDYALNYSPPLTSLSSSRSKYSTTSNSNSSMATVKAVPLNSINNSNHNNSNNNNSNINGINQSQITSSLTRNRQDSGLPSVQSSISSMQNGLLGQSLLQNGLSIDPRYSATYGNPYLRTSNSSLPPPNTANPAATPAPPPYPSKHHQQQQHHHQHTSSHLSNYSLTNSLNPLGSLSSNNLIIGSNSTLPSQATLLQQQQQTQQQTQQNISPSLTTAATTTTAITTTATTIIPPGQFILPSNGNLKKGALATHV
ncbi:irregular chiasm C-roughest protein-like [Condylostylus longicornis]|uniref:irregular chiasm C-roughest protein-like n=1 Tax=Condylostylus longicornis TaxID=2530218 RepID=UPI00244E3F38|nr:irregular chiasm C-roughest protein-like [Condylostylus longicornis]XP_055371597.1 irregular chiasm C-roughest protein-like [Condylostylus longicornis]